MALDRCQSCSLINVETTAGNLPIGERDSAVLAQKNAESAARKADDELKRITSRASTLWSFAEFCVQNMGASDDSPKPEHQRLFALKFLLTANPSAELMSTENEVYNLMGVTKDDASVWRGCFGAWRSFNPEKLVEIYTAPDSALSDEKKWFLKNFLAIKFSIDADVELRKRREQARKELVQTRIEEQRQELERNRQGLNGYSSLG